MTDLFSSLNSLIGVLIVILIIAAVVMVVRAVMVPRAREPYREPPVVQQPVAQQPVATSGLAPGWYSDQMIRIRCDISTVGYGLHRHSRVTDGCRRASASERHEAQTLGSLNASGISHLFSYLVWVVGPNRIRRRVGADRWGALQPAMSVALQTPGLVASGATAEEAHPPNTL